MSKAIEQTKISSYLDWSLGLKKPSLENLEHTEYTYKKNSLGISDDDFTNFMKKWKDENLS